MNLLHKLLAAASAAFFFASTAIAQNAGTVTNHALAVGKGPGVQGYGSVLLGNTQIPVGQTGADPQAKTVSGDATLANTGALTLATVNSNVGSFGSATNCVSFTTNGKGLITAASASTCTPAIASVTGLGTGVATALAVNVGTTGSIVTFNGALGTPSSGTLTNATGLPIATGVSGLGTGCATFLGTPSSANLRGCLTDEVGTGAAYFVGGALGTPASATLTNATGLPLTGLNTQAAWSFVVNNTSGSASPTAVDIASFTSKAAPAGTDLIVISDQAASGALKRATLSSIASAGSVASIAGNTGAFTLSTGITNSGNDIRLSLTNATLNGQPSNPTNTTSGTGVMMGLGVSTCRITPTYSGRVFAVIDGAVSNNTVGQVASFNLRVGTGAGPANGAAPTGTAVTSSTSTGNGGATYQSGFSKSAVITGLTPGVTIWLDLLLAASGGTSTMTSINCTAYEF